MLRTITDPTRFVDAEQLQCPGCGDPVRPERPVDGGGDWSHRDGSALCAFLDGTVCEPVEVVRPSKRVR